MKYPPHRVISVARATTIASNTLTELTHCRSFHVLFLFALVLIGSSTFMTQFGFQQEFQILKDTSLGSMSIFSSLLAILTTAQLIPRDLADRTIYTILSKPVTRFAYLLGKLTGVFLLLAISITVMSLAFVIVIEIREQTLLHEMQPHLSALSPEQTADALNGIR